MLASILLAASMWPSPVTDYCTPSAASVTVGVAKKASGEFLYCEEFERIGANSLKINYTHKGKLFAEKHLHYTTTPSNPLVQQQDFRSGELREADILGQTLKLRYLPGHNKKSSSVSIPLNKVDAVDAGFDNFLRDNWDVLQSGKKVTINFASIAHLKSLPLRISHHPLATCTSDTEPKQPFFCFVVEVNNSLLRILLDDIKLIYDEQHRLVNFNGVVNIQDEKGSNQTANIHYYYAEK